MRPTSKALPPAALMRMGIKVAKTPRPLMRIKILTKGAAILKSVFAWIMGIHKGYFSQFIMLFKFYEIYNV